MKKFLLFIYNFLKRTFSFKTPDLNAPETIDLHINQMHMVYRTAPQKSEPEVKELEIRETKTHHIAYYPPIIKISKTAEYNRIKSLDVKPVIQVKQVSREDALRLSNLEVTLNDVIKYTK